MNYPSKTQLKTREHSVFNEPEMAQRTSSLTERIRKKTFLGAMGVIAAITVGAPSAFADCANTYADCTDKDKADKKDGHGSYQFEFKVGPTITPKSKTADFGAEAHFTWIPFPESHDKPHFEWTILDLGVSFYRIPVNSGLPYNNKKSIQGTEFHFGTLANLVIPLGEVADIGLGGGFGVGFYYHPFANIGQDRNYNYWDVKSTTQTVPLLLLHGEITFHVADQVLVYGTYLPHFTLMLIQDEIPGHKHYHFDHTISAGIGAMF